MRQRSLRVRLLLGGALAIFVALSVAWLAMSYLFERHAERQVEADLRARGTGIVATLFNTPEGALDIEPLPSDPRFAAPASGLYWQVSGGANVLRSRSLWDETLPSPGTASAEDWSSGDLDGPFGQRLIYLQRQIRLDPQSAPLTIMVAADREAVNAARAAFSRELALFLLLLWLVLAAAAWAQVELGLRPLEDVRAALENLRRQASARLSGADYPTEAAPLAQAINELADAREKDLQAASRRAADLAHSLKTPLAALSAQSRRAREAGATEAAEGLDGAIAAAGRVVERELARTRAAAARGEGSADAHTAVSRLLQVIERTETGSRIAFDNDAVGVLPVSEDVLLEMIGPLLENAARFARRRVRIVSAPNALTIEDDGPGMDEAAAVQALQRGERLDERDDGHGLGLAIAHDLALASGAELDLSRAELGGLRVSLTWPQNR